MIFEFFVFFKNEGSGNMSETFMFAFCLLDTGALLFLLVYYVSFRFFYGKTIIGIPQIISFVGDHSVRFGVRLPQCTAVLLQSQYCRIL